MAHEIDNLVAVGLNHHTAPLEIRERLAMDEISIKEHLSMLVNNGVCKEAFLLSTCNRVELFGVPRISSSQSLLDYFCSIRGAHGVAPHTFRREGTDAVAHLFRVASSLDSLVVGEPQILGQVKTAVRLAEETETLGRLLRPLTRRTFSLAKKIRTHTQIGESTVGVGSAGVDLARQIFGELRSRRAMLIGTGHMGVEVAKSLQHAGLDELIIVNRTFEHAVDLAQQVGGTPVSMERLAEYLPRVDIVLAATAARQPILNVDTVRRALKKRKYKPLFLMDLSVPRNIAPAIDELDAAYLFNVDDLAGIVEQGHKARREASRQAEEMVHTEVTQFVRLMSDVEIGPMISRLTEKVESIRMQELKRSRRFMDGLSEEQQEELEVVTTAMVRKILHGPLRTLREAGRDGDIAQVRRILELWKDEE